MCQNAGSLLDVDASVGTEEHSGQQTRQTCLELRSSPCGLRSRLVITLRHLLDRHRLWSFLLSLQTICRRRKSWIQQIHQRPVVL